MDIKNNVITSKEEKLYITKYINNTVTSQNKTKKILKLHYENDDIIKKLKQSEKEIENREGIELDVAFKELRRKYGN